MAHILQSNGHSTIAEILYEEIIPSIKSNSDTPDEEYLTYFVSTVLLLVSTLFALIVSERLFKAQKP